MQRALLSFALLAALAAPAAAQESKTGFGVGAQAMLTGPAGAAIIYDADAWRIDAILAFHDDNNNKDIALGGRFIFVLHEGVGADFGVGAGVGIVMLEAKGDGDDTQDIHLEALAQLRAFVVPNVALSAAAGIGVVLLDNTDDVVDDIVLTGQIVGSIGIAYYFW